MLSILYVDDDEDLLDIGRTFLEQTGTLRVDISRSAGTALALMAKNHYDAVISDYKMPEMNGIAFLRNLRNSGNPVPFIMVTGHGGEDVAIDAFHAGADSYIRKDGAAKSRFAELARTVEKAVERKRAGAAPEYSNTFLREILESTSDGILVTGTNGTVAACNTPFFRMWKIPEDQQTVNDETFILTTIADRLENAAEFLCRIPRMQEHPDAICSDILRLKDGQVFRCSSRAWNTGSTVAGRVWSFQDITSQSRAEQELGAANEQLTAMEEELKSQYAELSRQVILLRESEMKYRRVFDEESDPLLLIDRKTGTILDLNTASCGVYGYTRDELLGLTIPDLLPESRRDTLKAGGEQHFVRASVHRRKNGTVFPVEVSGSDLVLGDRDIQILSVRDVTRTKMIENALKRANGKLSLLLGITRHDILNRLTALAISNEILSARLNDAGDREVLDLQKKAIQGIRDHIDFTREYDTLGLKSPGWQPLEKIVWRCFSQFLQTISFRCEIRNLEIYADPMIEKVFYNLFDNAFRYGEGITGIAVSCLRKGSDLCICFRDDGTGIPEGEKERIFERGFGKNTGLGLFFSREILSITGMEIRETGEYRNGAQFEIRIPEGQYRFRDSAGESYGCPGPAEPFVRSNCCEQEN